MPKRWKKEKKKKKYRWHLAPLVIYSFRYFGFFHSARCFAWCIFTFSLRDFGRLRGTISLNHWLHGYIRRPYLLLFMIGAPARLIQWKSSRGTGDSSSVGFWTISSSLEDYIIIGEMLRHHASLYSYQKKSLDKEKESEREALDIFMGKGFVRLRGSVIYRCFTTFI